MNSRKVYVSNCNPDISYFESIYLDSDGSSLYSNEIHQNDNYRESNDSEYNYEWSNRTWDDVNKVSEIFDRRSLYTEPVYHRESMYTTYENDKDDEDLNPIIELYAQSYEDYDNSEIEPVMSLPLTPKQHMLMKQKWNQQLEMELCKAALKQNQKIVSWAGFSTSSNSSDEDFPSVPRNSDASNLSNNSKKSVKSTRSWKSFLAKFSKKKKKEIKFYDDLLQK